MENVQALERRASSPAYQAYQILRWGFVAAPAIAGLDKFFNLLTDWDRYLAPQVTRRLPVRARTFMRAVGSVELAAAALVAWKPRIGSYVVAGWLGAIIGDLAMGKKRSLDVALRDVGLCLGAIALGRLSRAYAR